MALRTMTLREKLQSRLQLLFHVVSDGGVNQLQLGNKSGITWVPGVRAAKIRYGRVWAKVIMGQQSLRLSWGRSPANVDKTGDA
jgi:hypothetical protein